jgi:hypothetical protein
VPNGSKSNFIKKRIDNKGIPKIFLEEFDKEWTNTGTKISYKVKNLLACPPIAATKNMQLSSQLSSNSSMGRSNNAAHSKSKSSKSIRRTISSLSGKKNSPL